MISLKKPSRELLPSFLEALREGPFIAMQLGFGDCPADEIERDAAAYLALINSPSPFSITLNGRDYTVTDHELLWIADESRFLGTVALRYRGDNDILQHYAGHIGMAVRPALLNKGYGPRAIQALGQEIIERMRQRGIDAIFATCSPDNAPSRRLIEHFGGLLLERSEDVLGTGPSLRYRIALA
jgi:predicted acetyltransferase